jgi:predicted short-subunit dehydrogenase-like oxidoreductase (DUF2520 family)
MRELDRDFPLDTPACARLAIVGRGRLGTALAASLAAAGYDLIGPLGRDADPVEADAVLLCVPDGEIAGAAERISPGPLVGHCSGATTLRVLEPHEAFAFHPLMTVTTDGASFAGAGAAIAGSSARGLAFARELALALGCKPFEIADEDRAAYHAAASIASNFLITLEAAAERLIATAGADRELLVPLVRATVENWASRGAADSLTGPVARGDAETVERQREAVAERSPELVALFDALADATRALAATRAPADTTGPLATAAGAAA